MGWGRGYFGELYPPVLQALTPPQPASVGLVCHPITRPAITCFFFSPPPLPLPRDRETLGRHGELWDGVVGWLIGIPMTLLTHYFCLFLKPEAARGNTVFAVTAVGVEKETTRGVTRDLGPRRFKATGARVTKRHRPPGTVGRCSVSLSRARKPAGYSVGNALPSASHG